MRQRKENENMQKQIIELKKEKSLIQQSIMHASQKIMQLEDAVGC